MSETSSSPSDAAIEEDLDRIRRFYRDKFLPANAWSTLLPRPYLYLRQRQRRLRDTLIACGIDTPERLRSIDVLDVGAGTGTNLAWLVELGVDPARCTGIDLMPESVAVARERLPQLRWLAGDFSSVDVGGPFDVILLVAVLTSIKDPELKQRIVDKCLSLLRPGGVFFFYDYMSRKDERGSDNYKRLSYAELEGYLRGRKARWFKRDYLRASLAESIVTRFGVTAAELVQALGVFNIEASFAYVRV
ncbi:class I SAM-dependent methyltransferase [Polyangium sp. 15x6]|uniref:class I SAM-dependent methyltransferase n=1 Tax=Polyangium sp. 15x6 TaxID=3042687 RepID=UPI00249B7D60|nr:class I SAM-dependent methyltransferase [Polyangium sp. 15x6]MDI3286249.1 class I SAM-dependent methyltransferase [Polyangium sp. 15x6]